MASKRTYGDVCGIARALDLVGERWAMLIVRELLLGPKRFTDLRTGLPHLSPDVLTQRLRDLAEAGVIIKRKLPPPAASKVYELTSLGFELEPVAIALGRFGARLPVPAGDIGMSFDSHILTLPTLFDPELADGFEARVELRIDDQVFRAEVAGGEFEVERGEARAPDVVVETDHATLLSLVRGVRGLGDALEARDIRIQGDEATLERFLGLFPLPAPAVVVAGA